MHIFKHISVILGAPCTPHIYQTIFLCNQSRTPKLVIVDLFRLKYPRLFGFILKMLTPCSFSDYRHVHLITIKSFVKWSSRVDQIVVAQSIFVVVLTRELGATRVSAPPCGKFEFYCLCSFFFASIKIIMIIRNPKFSPLFSALHVSDKKCPQEWDTQQHEA